MTTTGIIKSVPIRTTFVSSRRTARLLYNEHWSKNGFFAITYGYHSLLQEELHTKNNHSSKTCYIIPIKRTNKQLTRSIDNELFQYRVGHVMFNSFLKPELQKLCEQYNIRLDY